MRILLTGATGFIGSALVEALCKSGHQVTVCMHRAPSANVPAAVRVLPVDFMHDVEVAAWRRRLSDIDVVINAVGILRESKRAKFVYLHERAPKALFQACVEAGINRVIQVSALGADESATSQYHRTKKAADDFLRASPLTWTIIQPSLVFGAGSASTQLFLRLASLPLTPLVGRGDQCVQPIHIDDLCALIVTLLDRPLAHRATIAAVGSQVTTLRVLLSIYRAAMGLGRLRTISIPLPWMRFAARIGDLIHAGALSSETLDMLLRGNTASAAAMTQLLGRPPRAATEFVSARDAPILRLHALASWLRPVVLTSLALMWIGAAAVSWIYAKDEGIELLQHLGFQVSAEYLFALACLLNLGLGLVTAIRPSRGLWLAQLAVMLSYTAALTYVAPGLWMDPFGPLLKNLPIATLLIGLALLDVRAPR